MRSGFPTVRLIQAAVKDRDIANRGTGKEQASDDEILQILAKMVKQRDESAKIYEENSRPELAAKERAEIIVIQDFMPKQLSDSEVRANRLGDHHRDGCREAPRTWAR